jgi:hypothetical protein
MEELLALQDKYTVQYDLEERWVELKAVQFPEGWQPRRGPVGFKLSSWHPTQQPKVYIPDGLRYYDCVPRHVVKTKQTGWNRWCIHELDWDEERHTLVTMLRLLLSSMDQPDTANPFTER